VVTDAVQALAAPAAPPSAAESIRLLTALDLVPVPCDHRGIRHSVLLLVVGAVMAGRTSWIGIVGWAARAEHAERTFSVR
jgi:hypothetical protein